MATASIRSYCIQLARRCIQKTPLSVLEARWSLRRLAEREWATGEIEIRLLPLVCDPARASLDIGANRGAYSYYLARHSRQCIAFEPNPRLARQLREAVGPKVEVMECAVSNEPSEVTLFIPLENGTELDGLSSVEGADRFQDHDLKEVAVSAVPLDALQLPPVGFMKIDVEGHELAVLEGACHLIERDAPTVILEAEERHRAGTVRACSAFLHERGYEGFFVLDHQILNIADFDI